MATEIERKFLVHSQSLPKLEHGKSIVQGYLLVNCDMAIRVRTIEENAFLTIKTGRGQLVRSEFEYEVPLKDAKALLNLCSERVLEKVRYRFLYKNKVWEVDVFNGNNDGLVTAEIELESEAEVFEKPEWISQEVTGEVRYYNAALSEKPYIKWNNLTKSTLS